jgi:abortive infection bacteriophage resistance protein
MKYSKPALSIADQIAALESRGLYIPDKSKAAHYLSHISYYRLRAYTYPYQDNRDPNHPFVKPVNFDDILNDYVFDRKLRIIVFDSIEKIEVALRTQIIYQFSCNYGSHWFEQPRLYRDKRIFHSDLKHLDKEIGRSQEEFIRHYFRKYTHPKRPPAWMAMEVTTLGTLSKMYENLQMTASKKAVARHFGLGHPDVLESWMRTFSHVRNISAHHSRLWNRQITLTPILPKRPADAWLNSGTAPDARKLFTTLCCIRYFLNRVSPGNSLAVKIKDLIALYPSINLKSMGFTSDWGKEPVWL